MKCETILITSLTTRVIRVPLYREVYIKHFLNLHIGNSLLLTWKVEVWEALRMFIFLLRPYRSRSELWSFPNQMAARSRAIKDYGLNEVYSSADKLPQVEWVHMLPNGLYKTNRIIETADHLMIVLCLSTVSMGIHGILGRAVTKRSFGLQICSLRFLVASLCGSYHMATTRMWRLLRMVQLRTGSITMLRRWPASFTLIVVCVTVWNVLSSSFVIH